MLLEELLLERASSIIYHYTSTSNAYQICKNNEFVLKGNIGTDSEENITMKGKPYYLSTTRHKLGGYNISPGGNAVMMVLNGDKLNQKYSAKAVDYWGEEFRKIDPTKFEAEDRIFSKTPTIKNAKKYIKEIHIIIKSRNKWDNSNLIRNERRLLLCLKTSGIPYYLYDNKDDFLLQNKKNSIKLDIDTMKTTEKEYPPYFSNRKSSLYNWIDLYHKKEYNNLNKETQQFLDKFNINPEYHKSEHVKKLKADLHNEKSSDIKAYNKFINVYNATGSNTVDEFINYIIRKWLNA